MDHIIEQLQLLCGQLGIPLPAQHPAAPPEQKPAAPLAPKPVLYQPASGIECWCCDFRDLPVQPESVAAVLTDIPYERPWLPNVAEFSEWCSRALKPGGIMVSFLGQSRLGEFLLEFSKHLTYRWLIVSPIYGGNTPHNIPITSHHQIAAVYSKGTFLLPQAVDDRVPSGARNKRWHPHQKTISQMQYLVEAFSEDNSLVCDPCAGSFTTAEACWHTNRRFIGSDINPECLEMAKKRFSALNI